MEKVNENNFSSATKTSLFVKNTKNNHSSASDWWKYTKYRFKENAQILSKNSTIQENITVSRKNLLFLLKTQKSTSSASVWWENTQSSFKVNARTFPKSSTIQENIRISKPKKGYEIFTKRTKHFEPNIKPKI